jgi:hypothetical protein
MVMLVIMTCAMAGAAYGLKKNYDPGPVSAVRYHGEPLNGYESHAAFEKECRHCHAPVRCLSANLCQDCHREIAEQRAAATGLHGLLPGTDKCQTCHREHRGRDAIISAVSLVNIDHEALTGFSLARHQVDDDGAPLTCQRCHTSGRFALEGVDCTGCHAERDAGHLDEHTQRYGDDCTGCHDGRDRMIDLDHSQYYLLDGGHEGLDCRDCHADQVFAAEVRDCVACHEDPEVHAGDFGLDCSRCHTAAAWTPAQLTRHVFFLDHGSEDQLECEVCHEASYVEYTCYGCHDHTPADMQEIHAQAGIEDLAGCAAGGCHPTGQPGEAVQAAQPRSEGN